jgi:predicted porin
MKKLTLTLAISSIVLASSGAMAKTVYKDDGMSLDLTGEIAWEVRRDADDNDPNDPNEFRIDDAAIEISPSYMLESGVKVFGTMELQYNEQTDEGVTKFDAIKDVWVGASFKGVEVRIGDQDYASDHFGISEHKDADQATVIGDDDSPDGSDEVFVVEYENDMVFVSASYEIPEGKPDAKDGAGYDVFVEGYLGDATLAAAVTFQDHDGSGSEDPVTATGLSAEYDIDDLDLKLAAEFTYEVESENMAYQVSAEYDVIKEFDIGAGVGQKIFADDSIDAETYYYVNLDYDLHKDVDIYAEMYGSDRPDYQLGYVLGISLDF